MTIVEAENKVKFINVFFLSCDKLKINERKIWDQFGRHGYINGLNGEISGYG